MLVGVAVVHGHAGGCAVALVVPQQRCESGVVGVIEHHPVLSFCCHLVEWVVAVEGESVEWAAAVCHVHVVGCVHVYVGQLLPCAVVPVVPLAC